MPEGSVVLQPEIIAALDVQTIKAIRILNNMIFSIFLIALQ
jgi:hypothetical protein